MRTALPAGSRTQQRECGFTLLELLVAMGIFALVSVMAMGGLNAVLSQQSQARKQLARLHELQRAVNLMSNDFGQASPRYARDYLKDQGAASEPPFFADGRGDPLVRLTRDGWPNPARQARGTLQRVQYRIEKDKLIREYWPVVDWTVNTNIQTETILQNFEKFELAFLDNSDPGSSDAWHDTWPPLRTGSSGKAPDRPRAVRIRFKLKDWGEIERLVEVPQ